MRIFGFSYWLAPGILALAGCYPQTGAGPRDVALRTVEVAEIRSEEVAETLSLIGLTEPWQEAVLYFEVSGVVAEVFVEEGDLIEPGAPVTRLVLDDYELALSRAKAELGAAQAELDLLNAGTRKEDLEAAEADYARARVRAAYWTSELRRAEELFKKDTISASELEQAQREHDAADQEERSTKALWERAVAGPRKEEIEAAEAEVDARKQAAAQAKRQLDKATLRAPFRGRVERRLLDVGAYVNVFPTGGVPVVHLVDLEQVDAVISVPEALLPRLQGKQQVEIVSAVDAENRADGEIISIGKVANRETGTYELRARISNPEGRLTGSMVVEAKIVGEASRRAVRIPITAVCRAYGQPPYVLLVESDGAEPKRGKVVAREVELGPVTGDRVEISGGLSEGDVLIVRGQDRVVAGDQVKTQRADAAPPAAPATRTERPVP
jgi:RND family efflux transporter MFP subunit